MLERIYCKQSATSWTLRIVRYLGTNIGARFAHLLGHHLFQFNFELRAVILKYDTPREDGLSVVVIKLNRVPDKIKKHASVVQNWNIGCQLDHVIFVQITIRGSGIREDYCDPRK